MPDRIPLRDSPQHHVSAASARCFLRQVWRELQGWTLTAFHSAQTLATAAMNVLLLSVVAVFAVLAVLILLIRDEVMDQSPASVEGSSAQLHTLSESGVPTDRMAG